MNFGSGSCDKTTPQKQPGIDLKKCSDPQLFFCNPGRLAVRVRSCTASRQLFKERQREREREGERTSL